MKGSPTKVLIRLRCQTNPDKGRFTRLKCLTCLPGSPTIFGSLCQQQCLGGGEVGGNMPHSDSLVGYGETFKDTFYFGTSKIQIVHSGYETIILSHPQKTHRTIHLNRCHSIFWDLLCHTILHVSNIQGDFFKWFRPKSSKCWRWQNPY